MTRENRKTFLTAAMVAIAALPLAALAAPVTIDQTLLDKQFELGGVDYVNPVGVDVDASVVQNDPASVNEQSGNDNVQENKSEFAPSAESKLRQNLTGQDFNTDPPGLANPTMQNTVDLNVSSSDPIVADVGVNAAAGAFNLQINASVIAAGGDLLSQSAGDIGQGSLSNISLLQDAVNDVVSNIVVDEVIANVGVNAVSGVGNAQINSFTATTPF
jgi:hypothetical protein